MKTKYETEFESFYWQLLHHTKHLNQQEQDQLKSKIRRTCENYARIKTPYKYKKTIENLSNNKNIIILKQDKGRGVVILNCKSYIEKCCKILETGQFRKLEIDPTEKIEGKLQRMLRSIKNMFAEREYKQLYPTGSKPAAFYGNAKVHKLRKAKGLKESTLRPIVSNVGMATYNTAKYSANLLAPLAKSDNTIINTADFINRLKEERIPRKYKMISFDVKSLFTNVPLNGTISIILRKIYDEGKIETNIPRNVMKELLLLCTKHLHFTFNGDIYIQLDGVAMGSPLGSLLANVFMCSLEEAIVPTLKDSLVHWKRYLDDTHAHIEPERIDYVIKKLNTYHQQIQFNCKLEKYLRISFLDVSIRRLTNGKLKATVFRKETNTDIYMHWNSHAPMQWKIKTLKNLVKRSTIICSDQHLLQIELDHLRKVFVEINDYPSKTVENIIKNKLEKENVDFTNKPQTNTTNNSETKLQLFLPFSGKQGIQLLSKMKK